MDRIELEIVAPDRLVLSERVDSVVLPGSEGYLGVLPGHAPLLTALRPGEVSYKVGEVTRRLAVSGGFAEVLRARVSILAETCERAEEIDVERARRARSEALALLAREDLDASERRRAEAALGRAEARLRAADHAKP